MEKRILRKLYGYEITIEECDFHPQRVTVHCPECGCDVVLDEFRNHKGRECDDEQIRDVIE
jgi:hypothetical protein